ncbi:MAG: DUF350 domain-containing protein [Leptospiraceae bacterium]|nr:DUF350 domain-containing protein [Leptospiraceae bacterium]MCP5496025.1 DUF350 domain-containing protein [Leptospiraceae bacterium]
MPEWLNHQNLRLVIIIETILYASLGVTIFGIAIWLMAKLAPFSIRKEIEEDQNTSLGIIMGSVIIGIAIILAAVLK